MKKALYLTVGLVLLASNALAKHDCSCAKCGAGYSQKMSMGGFNDMAAQPLSIAVAKKQGDESYVTMQGYITKRLSDDEYAFTDGTDNIVLEIDDKVWKGQVVSPKDKVVVFGELEKDGEQFNVEVKSLKLMSK